MTEYDRNHILTILNNCDKYTEGEVEVAIAELGHVAEPEDKDILYSFLDSPNKEIVSVALMSLWLGLDEHKNMKDKIVQYASDFTDDSSLLDSATGALVAIIKEEPQMLNVLIKIAESYKMIDKEDESFEFINNVRSWQELAELAGKPLSKEETNTLYNYPLSEESETIRNQIRAEYKK
ncbi:MAG: hypothetical protein LBL62_02655 [Planctomycetaceae bacterium]|nr:hypothetical protein [Planctomycetaceae bacterium]